MKLVKVIDEEKKYLDKKGKEHYSTNYYIVLDSGKRVSIRPSFGQGYFYLDAICETVKNGKEHEE